jgi:glycerol-3-phosphate acyltransferase PlsY
VIDFRHFTGSFGRHFTRSGSFLIRDIGFRAGKVDEIVLGLVYVLLICLACMSMSCLYVLLVCLAYISCSYVVLICRAYMSCLYVVLICRAYMLCLYVVLICRAYMSAVLLVCRARMQGRRSCVGPRERDQLPHQRAQ